MEPINASATAWRLEAAPGELSDAAGQLRSRAWKLVSAQVTIDEAAASVASGDWTGETADVFQDHRAKVTGDLGETARIIGTVADSLDTIADTLTSSQGMLDDEWARIESVPHLLSGHDLRFTPRDAAEETAVRQAISAATLIRAALGEELALKEASLHSAKRELAAVKEAWQPRTLTAVNFNVGQGHGNAPAGTNLAEDIINVGPWNVDFDNPEDGTERAEMDEIADIIHAEGGDVATLQEVFEEDLDELEEQLESDGSQWTVHYQEASPKPHFDDSIIDFGDPDDFDSHSFGNAVIVREGSVVSGSEEVAGDFELDVDGSEVPVTSAYPYPDALPDEVGDGEGRAATVAQINLDL